MEQLIDWVKVLCLIWLTIFRTQTDHVRKGIATCSQTYNNLPELLTLQRDNWMQARNDMLSCAINTLSHNSTKTVQKSVAVDHLYSLVQLSFVSPFIFAVRFLVYSKITSNSCILNILLELLREDTWNIIFWKSLKNFHMWYDVWTEWSKLPVLKLL